MSERERWIIYPLLFFALGAAVRDKMLHRIDAKEIYCESLMIIDQQHPLGRPLVELGIQRARPNDPTQLAERVGMLRLSDSNGVEVCHVTEDATFQRIFSRHLVIRDENRVPLVVATSEPGTGLMLQANGIPSLPSQGVIYLNNQRLVMKMAAPAAQKPKPASQPQPEERPGKPTG